MKREIVSRKFGPNEPATSRRTATIFQLLLLFANPLAIILLQRWNVKMIRDFMIYIGPLSSIYDFLTFFALLKIFHASEQIFHSGWFVESLATQTLVIFVIRTARNPLRSRPSLALTLTTISVVIFGTGLPFTALGKLIGFTTMPVGFLVFIATATGTYLILVELVRRRLMRRLLE